MSRIDLVSWLSGQGGWLVCSVIYWSHSLFLAHIWMLFLQFIFVKVCESMQNRGCYGPLKVTENRGGVDAAEKTRMFYVLKQNGYKCKKNRHLTVSEYHSYDQLFLQAPSQSFRGGAAGNCGKSQLNSHSGGVHLPGPHGIPPDSLDCSMCLLWVAWREFITL